MNSVHYVGMDVDKEKIILARLGAGTAKEVQEHVIANTPGAVKKYFTALLAGAEVWTYPEFVDTELSSILEG